MSQQRGRVTPYYTPPSQKKQAPSSTPAVSQTKSPTSSTQPGTVAYLQQYSLKILDRLWQQIRRTLKGQFSVMAVVILLLALVLAWFVSWSFSRASNDLNTIEHSSVPSVDAAQALTQYIDDIDAKAADFLGTVGLNDNPVTPCRVPALSGPPIDKGNQWAYLCDRLTIDAELSLANQQLFNAAHNVTYPGGRTAVERITEGLEEYAGYLELMMREYDLAANKEDVNDLHLQAAYQAYLNAGKVLHIRVERQPTVASGRFAYSEPIGDVPICVTNGRTLQPDQWAMASLKTNIDCLGAINYLHLEESAYTDTQNFVRITVIVTVVLCLIFGFLLLFTSARMIVITHRIINPGLMFALVASIALSVASISVLASLQGDHGAYGQIVKRDYQSAYNAGMLKRLGTNANADKSRWLIALKFNNTDEEQRWATDWQSNVHEISHLLQRARANQTWTEELQPLADMQTNLQTYFDIDGQIRSAAKNDNDPQRLHTAEIISTGKSHEAFGNFTGAVDQLKKANYDHYYATLNTTQNLLNAFIRLSAVVFPLIGLAVVWGVSQRFKDL